MATLPVHSNGSGYYAVSPAGDRVPISKEIFAVLQRFVSGEKPPGSMAVTFRNGGICGVKAILEWVYK